MNVRYILFAVILTPFLFSCIKGEQVDLIIHNGTIHTMTEGESTADAIAIKDGKIVEVGPERQILNKYTADEYVDAEKKDVFPGWTDAHGHILGYAKQKISVDLVGCKSYDEMIERIQKYQSEHNRPFIIGRGWDQSLWGENELPNNTKLNEVFPDIPVCLYRIDGHALLANDHLISKSDVINKFNNDDEINTGGYIIYDGSDKATGVFVDNAMNPIIEILPEFPQEEMIAAIGEIQKELLSYGITGVHEAGMIESERKMFEKMIDDGKLEINLYGMLLPTKENISFAEKNGIYQHGNLLIRSFKVYGDGALGSRGACLKKEYHDHPGHFGYLTTSYNKMEELAELCLDLGYQMNTHAIGDSTNKVVLDIYKQAFIHVPDHRWRIEHAQVVDSNDFRLFAEYGVFPSVQPTHATSDQRWAESRLGKERMDGAYPYRSLLENFGILAIGTDFPVEYIDPFRTIHSAVNRMNSDNYPEGGFLPNEKITLDQCIKGMTIWAAIAAFQENELGSLEAGKEATISIFDKPVEALTEYQENFAFMVFIKGKKVYSVE